MELQDRISAAQRGMPNFTTMRAQHAGRMMVHPLHQNRKAIAVRRSEPVGRFWT